MSCLMCLSSHLSPHPPLQTHSSSNLAVCSPGFGPLHVPRIMFLGTMALLFPWLAPYHPSKPIQALSLGIHPIVLHTHTHPPADQVHLNEVELH